MTTTRWRFRPHDRDKTQGLSREANVSPLVAQILLNRGIHDPAVARVFLEAKLKQLHDPELLPGAVEASKRIVKAIREKRKIVVYGDYDVDGVCATSILWTCLKLAGATEPAYYIPHRLEEGYGVNADAIRKIVTELGGSMIITVDCGISAVHEAKLARELGVEFIITDHHTPGDVLPEADAIVHPRVGETAYPCPDLCGAAVAFKLAWLICKTFGDGKKASPMLRDFLLRSLGMVALATVADVVPLTGENRILVRHGLLQIENDPSAGIHALLEVSGSLGNRKLNTGTVGFGLGPRINAAGRLERAMRAVELLTTDDNDIAITIAQELDAFNLERREVEDRIVREAMEMVRASGGSTDHGAVVVGKQGWHAGVVGIVASRLVETFHRPAIVIALNEEYGQGSARSIPGFNLHDAIKACSSGLTAFGGHAAAAGLKLPLDHFQAFADAFDLHCKSVLTPEMLQKVITIDAEVPLASLTTKIVDELDLLEPFGIGNPRPVLAASQVRVVGEPRVVGPRKNHLQIRFGQGDTITKAVAWNMAERWKTLRSNDVCSIAFVPSINEWNGRRDVQLEIKDLQREEGESPGSYPE